MNDQRDQDENCANADLGRGKEHGFNSVAEAVSTAEIPATAAGLPDKVADCLAEMAQQQKVFLVKRINSPGDDKESSPIFENVAINLRRANTSAIELSSLSRKILCRKGAGGRDGALSQVGMECAPL